jgi:hypothetical protein
MVVAYKHGLHPLDTSIITMMVTQIMTGGKMHIITEKTEQLILTLVWMAYLVWNI